MEILGGPLFAVAGAGESHGPGVTTIVFGCPAGLRICREEVQQYLDRRRPGSNRHGTPRQEGDRVVLLSGLYAEGEIDHLLSGPAVSIDGESGSETESYEEGYSTGEPIAALVLSTSQRSRHYDQFAGPRGEVRPGTHRPGKNITKSQGFVDIRGGGRSSYRSTISDVIGGAIARIFLNEQFGTVILSSIAQVGPLQTNLSLAQHFESVSRQQDSQSITPEQIAAVEAKLDEAEIRSLDAEFAQEAGELIKRTRIEGDSLGSAVEVVAVNPPSLVGEPLYQSLKVRLMGSLGGLNAVQSCEVGDGVRVISRRGSENNDPIRRSGYQSNSHGGLIGGMTTGSPLVCRVGFKPTSTILKMQQSVRKNLEEIDFALEAGRHDPCVGVRAGVTLESRLAIELMNAVLMHQSGRVDAAQFQLF